MFVKLTPTNGSGKLRIIEAANKVAALRHAAHTDYKAEPANSADIAEFYRTKAGEIEKAGDDAANPSN